MGLFSRSGLRLPPDAQATRPSRAAAPPAPARTPRAARPPLLLAYATQTGVAEHYAHQTLAQLQRSGAAVRLVAFEALSLDALRASTQALILASTTYDGDAPDMAGEFIERWMRAPASLDGLDYGLLSLGDSCYREFCGFGRRLHAWLAASGAHPLFPSVEVDDEDAAALARWFAHVGELARR